MNRYLGALALSAALIMPVSQRGDVLVIGRVNAMLPSGTLMLLLCLQVSPVTVFQDLSGVFMSSQMIFFSVMLGAATMGVGGQVMVLGSDLL